MHKRLRRARQRGVEAEQIDVLAVYERDGWRCQLCTKLVDRTQTVPRPKAPTIDHIVPVSLGGGHLMVNVQCAHFICNVRKGNRGTDQLRLLG
jgi:5-methylcytosine-specific restriction endonuclease McrA